MKNRIIGIINAVLTVGAFAGINTVFHACRGEMKMPCNYSVKAASLILILLLRRLERRIRLYAEIEEITV